jgi:hypothetical protein
MKVLIDGRYTCETDLDDIEVGDEMVLPGSSWSGQWTGIVTSLEPTYGGPCKRTIGLSRRRAKVEAENKALKAVRITGWRRGEAFAKPCRQCGQPREHRVQEVNNIGRPTSVHSDACTCGEPSSGAGLGSANAFRHYMIDPSF